MNLLALLLLASLASAKDVGGVLKEDTVWSGTVVIVEDVIVSSGVTLTIEPGTEVIPAPDVIGEGKGWDPRKLEMKVRENWSLAAFYDVGNAFNDWDEMELKQGVGLGIRWYTIAGAMRLDYAKALDLDGEPWRIHFTIGTSLL